MTCERTDDMKAVLLTDEDVAQYLLAHPDFFLRQTSVLTELRLPHAERGTISLFDLQLSRLRQRVGDLEEEITQLMTRAVSNEKLFRHFSQAHTALFTAQSIECIELALANLCSPLNLKVCLRFYDMGTSCLSRSRVEELKRSHFGGNAIYLGRLSKKDGLHFIDDAPELGSYALSPIIHDKEIGFLTFASRDGGHFQPTMDTLFIEQIASHIAVLLSRW